MNYLIVYDWMTDLGLSSAEMIALAAVASFTASVGRYSGGAKWLSRWTGLGAEPTGQILKKLESLGLVRREIGQSGVCFTAGPDCNYKYNYKYNTNNKNNNNNINIYNYTDTDTEGDIGIGEEKYNNNININGAGLLLGSGAAGSKALPDGRKPRTALVKDNPLFMKLLESYGGDLTKIPRKELEDSLYE